MQKKHRKAFLLLRFRALHDEVIVSQDLALAQEDDLHHCVHAVAGHGHHILISAAHGDGFLLLQHLLHGHDAVAQHGCPLKLQLLGGLHHLFAQALDHILVLSVEKGHDLIQHLHVLSG